MATDISSITGIAPRYLTGRGLARTASVAVRMSWFSRRQTTRKEDVAYCMLGVFDVNMPLLYGEGAKAFLRLQMEIIRKSSDQTIFAWADTENYPMPYGQILAQSPNAFVNSAMLMASGGPGLNYIMTKRGLELHVAHRMWIRRPELMSAWIFSNGTIENTNRAICELRLDCQTIAHGRHYVACIEFMQNLIAGEKLGTVWGLLAMRLRPIEEVRALQQALNEDLQDATLVVWQTVA